MTIKKEEAYQHVLCMDLSRHHFQCAVVNPTSKKIVDSMYMSIETFEKEAVASLITDDFFFYEYNSLVLSAGTERNTLVPVDIFNESSAKDIFALNFSEPIENVDYNRIPELGIVNIYEFPMWIKSLFVVKFPRVKIVHRSSVLLRATFDQPTFSPKVHLFVEEHQFYLMITAKSKLQFFNRFDSEAVSDILYHTLNVLEQKGLPAADMDFNVYGQHEDWDGIAELKRMLAGKVKIASEAEKGKDFILAKQLLCV